LDGEQRPFRSCVSPRMAREARWVLGRANEKFSEVPNSTVIKAMLLSTAVLARVALPCDSGRSDTRTRIGMASVTKTSTNKSPKREKTNYNRDKRRKHHHFLVTVFYADGEKFGRVYTDKDKADRFADRQKRSPVVKSARVTMVS
jgi:hypothetical protein